MQNDIENVIATIDYIEGHLSENLDLDTVAEAVNYSKYHLHRMFTGAVGLTIHDYVQRRKLTEAAKLLVEFGYPTQRFVKYKGGSRRALAVALPKGSQEAGDE